MKGAMFLRILKKFWLGGRFNCQLLNVQWPGGIRKTEIHTEEPFVPGPSAAEVEVAFRKMKRYKSPGSDQIPAELIQAGGGGIAFCDT
jgi:hypothetical protein